MKWLNFVPLVVWMLGSPLVNSLDRKGNPPTPWDNTNEGRWSSRESRWSSREIQENYLGNALFLVIGIVLCCW